MLFRLLLIIVIVGIVIMLFRRLRAPQQHQGNSQPTSYDPMVRCAHCGVNLPRDHAIRSKDRWALAFGAGFGGNGTIIGSTANIIVASLSERTRTPITSKLWLKRGLPVMLATCAIASILYTILYSWF